MHAALPTHFILLDFIILFYLVKRRFTKPLAVKFSPASFCFLRFSSKYSPLHPVLKDPQFVLPLIWQNKFHTNKNKYNYTVTWLSVIIDRVWIGDRIYWTLWYSAWLHFTVHYYIHTCVHSYVFTGRYLVSASNGGHSPSSWFPSNPCASATSF
jgi:hypothetical protein